MRTWVRRHHFERESIPEHRSGRNSRDCESSSRVLERFVEVRLLDRRQSIPCLPVKREIGNEDSPCNTGLRIANETCQVCVQKCKKRTIPL